MFIAIHQPNFLPWIGFFHKISQVERFIFFDNVPSPQGKSWLSRSRINLNGEQMWFTVPIHRSHRSGQLIRDAEIVRESSWVRKHLGTLLQAYNRAPFYKTIIPQIEQVYRQEYRFLADFNVALIEAVSRIIGLECQYHRASERVSSEKRKTEMIVQVCQAFECHRYLTGLGGSLDFLEPQLFHDAGIELVYQKFKQPTYEHPSGVYLEGMSILDALFCLGPEHVRDCLVQQSGFYHSREEIGNALETV
jgi:hypothetical protein